LVFELLLDPHHALAQLDLVHRRRLAEALLDEPVAMLVLMKSMSSWVRVIVSASNRTA
jgi:hypothetical protein